MTCFAIVPRRIAASVVSVLLESLSKPADDADPVEVSPFHVEPVEVHAAVHSTVVSSDLLVHAVQDIKKRSSLIEWSIIWI